MKKRLCISVLLIFFIRLGYGQGITVAFRLPYEYTKVDTALNKLREVLSQQKITEVKFHANYRIYINRPQGGISVNFAYKIKVEKGNITVDAPNDMGLINGILYIAEQLKKTHSVAKIKSKTFLPS